MYVCVYSLIHDYNLLSPYNVICMPVFSELTGYPTDVFFPGKDNFCSFHCSQMQVVFLQPPLSTLAGWTLVQYLE